jgi:hypothetical protein
MAYDEFLAQRIRDALEGHTGIAEKKMFGRIAFLRDGLMLAGVSGKSLMARIGPAAYEESLRRQHVREMNFTGKPMKGYVFVEEAGLRTAKDLEYWVQRCEEFVATLPPKGTK